MINENEIVMITIILLIIIGGILYCKMILIWRDVMLKQNDKWLKDSKRLKQIQNEKAPIRRAKRTVKT